MVYGIDVKFDVYILVLDVTEWTSEINLVPASRKFAGTFVNLRHGAKKIMNEDDTMIKKNKKSFLN